METILLHLIKSSGLLCIFFFVYLLFLRRDKSFVSNRFFLMAGIISSFFLPFVEFTRKIVQEGLPQTSEFSSVEKAVFVSSSEGIGVWQLAGLLYLIVTGLLLIKVFREIFMILRLASAHAVREGNFRYINTRAKITPFSFFNIIVFNAALHSEEELKMIIQHEKVHALQGHSLDIILSNILTAVLWFNPISWYYKRYVEQNLEFLADKETLAVIGRKKEYQYALLRVSQSGSSPSLLSYFHHSYIKNRVRMLGKDNQANRQWKSIVVLPFILFFLYSFNVNEKTIFIENETVVFPQTQSSQEPIFYIDRNTSDQYLEQLESFFSKEYPTLKISITGVTRDKDQFLTGFELRTKFKGEKEFHRRLENKGNEKLKPRFSLQYSSHKPSLIVKEQGLGEELEIQITQQEMRFTNPIIKNDQ